MRTLATDFEWTGLGGPEDMGTVSRSKLANEVRLFVDTESDFKFTRTKGGAATVLGPGAAAWSIKNLAIARNVTAEVVEESVDGGADK